MIIKCTQTGCESTFETDAAMAADAKFICRVHTPVVTQDLDLHFQRSQFSKEMKYGRKPIGTTHINNQASATMDSEHIRRLLLKDVGDEDGE
jgi:hypothetical protein